MDNQEPRPIPPKPAAPPTAGLPQVAVPPAATEPPPRKPRRVASSLLKALFVLVLLGVVGALVWLATWLDFGAPETSDDGSVIVEISPTPLATPLPLPREGVEPPDYRLGDCFKDFDPEALRSTVVACDTGHSAQLVAVFRYPAVGSYPGLEALAAKALEACQAARLAPAANEYTLNFQRAYPSSTSWESGDRRVDCYVTADGGNVINASVLP
ncbi:MAG: septum formation family protein [Actinomycetota bacterium]|nr:septum formation family protein [Actinomycetota bacterium]